MTRTTLNKAFAVGLLVAVCGVAFLIAFTFFRKGGYAEKDTYLVHAFFDDATGLTWKSRVQIAGIQVGEVERIVLEGNRARLELRVKKEIDLRADACVTKRYPSALLPDALLDAVPGTVKAPSLRDLPSPEQREIRCVVDAITVAKLLDSLSKISTDIQGVTRELSGMVAGSEGSIREIIGNLARVSARLDQTVASGESKVSAILDNAESFTGTLAEVAEADRERYRAIARNVEEASARLAQVLQSVQGLIGDSKDQGALRGSLEDARQSLARLNHSMEQIEKVAVDIGQGQGVAGKLLADKRLGEKLSGTLENVSDYVDRLYKMKIEVRLRSEWLLNQTGAKTYAGIALVPRPDKYYLFEVVSDPRGVNTQTVETITSAGPGGVTTSTTTRTLNEQKLSISLQFAKRYGPATFRVGFVEGSGGGGADLHLLDDSLRLSFNIYQFSRPATDLFPRTKLWVDYTFWRYVYLTAGSDDFLNRFRGGRYPGGPRFTLGTDVFFGAGLVFTDEDLKTLLSFGGSSAGAALK